MVIVAFGDSITRANIGVNEEENWLALLQQKLGNGFRCINSGCNGNSAAEAMARYEKDVLSHEPDLVLLEFGGNNQDPYNAARHVSQDRFREYLAQFKAGLPAHCRVVVITFPPVIDEWHSARAAVDGGKVDIRIEPYREITRQFARDNDYLLFDLYRVIYPDRYKLILKDGVHLNAEGQKVFAGKLFELIKKEGIANK